MQKRHKLQIVTALLGAFLAFLVAEGALRLAGLSAPLLYRPDPVRGWGHAPGVRGLQPGEGEGPVAVAYDRRGLRGDDPARPKPATELRVVVLGDSMAEALQVPREAAFAEQLERRLEECPHRPPGRPATDPVEVIGLGVSGYGTAQKLLTLGEQAPLWEPDLVVLLFYAGNDLRDNHPALTEQHRRPFLMPGEGDPAGWEMDFSFRKRGAFRLRSGFWAAPAYGALEHSRLLQLALTAWTHRGLDPTPAAGGPPRPSPDDRVYLPSPPPPWEEAWTVTGELLRRTAATAWAAGADFLLVSASTGVQVHPDRAVRRTFAAGLGVDDLLEPERRLAAIARSQGFPYLPLVPSLTRRAEELGHPLHGAGGYGHWNRAGHAAAAERVGRELCRSWATEAGRPAAPSPALASKRPT